MRLGMILIMLLALSNCTSVQYVSQPLPLPARPVLPVVYQGDLSCLSDETYARIVERERLRREYAERLEVIIQSTHSKGQ